jgi:hypothetical protein
MLALHVFKNIKEKTKIFREIKLTALIYSFVKHSFTNIRRDEVEGNNHLRDY